MLDLFAKSVNSESENLEAVHTVTGYFFSTHYPFDEDEKKWNSAFLNRWSANWFHVKSEC